MTRKEKEREMKKVFIIICMLFVGLANADNVITSKEYVDTAGATLQPQVPAKNTNTVLTYPAAGTETPGEKAIYDSNESMAGQSKNLVTAGQFNTALQNALDTEFVCVSRNEQGCLLYEIRAAYHKSRNLFNKDDIDPRWCWIDVQDHIGQNISTTVCINSSGNFGHSNPISITPNVTYTVSNHVPAGLGANPSFLFLDENLVVLDGFKNLNRNLITFTVPNNASIKYLVIPIHRDALDTAQLEEGSVATPYVPYGNIYLPQGNE